MINDLELPLKRVFVSFIFSLPFTSSTLTHSLVPTSNLLAAKPDDGTEPRVRGTDPVVVDVSLVGSDFDRRGLVRRGLCLSLTVVAITQLPQPVRGGKRK